MEDYPNFGFKYHGTMPWPWYDVKNDAIWVDFLTPTDFSKNMRNGKKWPSNMIPVTLKDQNFLKNVLWETIYH